MRVAPEMRVTVSHSGKQHSYQHALSLQRLGVLHQFVTSSYYRRSRWPDCVARQVPRIDAGLQKRWLNGLDEQRVSRRIDLELPELWYRNILKNGGRAELAMFQRDTRFDQWVSNRWAHESDVFWGFQGSCLDSLRAARTAGRMAVCEFATAHVTSAIRILSEEAEKHPEWAGTISNFHFPDWYRERLEQEPFEADFCVAASSFSQQSLIEAGIDSARIRMLPLGADLSQFPFAKREPKGPLKVLFVGGIGQRKGIKYLLEAVKNLNSPQIQLQLLGPLPADTSPLDEWSPWFDYLGRTTQTGVARHMQEADVLVLPSVFEGFGLVILEAMATGLPVIASTHSCAPEVIEEAVSGFALRHDDVNGLSNKLAWCAENRSELSEMGRAARQRALDFSWESHTNRLKTLLDSLEVSDGS
uniref:Glycosyl transferase group 1 n=1 Tax=Rubinisphaera brasiliensis (strain ATCC 49424 / DSM 5305 / JCM 21570 / IAM 15109 / NBRC 103401 / IFAM 1448) TaxID=756272 RepID=F0SI59_RUBBR|nr:glycosyl transferase group 1 [Rubinisphaera brasiliensis DSM 5305]